MSTPSLPVQERPNSTFEDLRVRRDQLKHAHPKMRARELAAALHLSEAEYVSLDVGVSVTRIEGDFNELLKSLEPLGTLMGLTRNESCVHERKGVYTNFTFYEGKMNMGVAVNPDIDLRLFMNQWDYGLAVTMERGPKLPTLHGFHFYDKHGVAVHKIYTTVGSNLKEYWPIVERFMAKDQTPIVIDSIVRQAKPVEADDETIDVDGFRESWKSLKDTHDFYPMLRKYGVTRTQALRLAPEGMVTEVNADAISSILEGARDAKVPIMCFVHSTTSGCIQIHTGPVNRLVWHGDWYNVMDPDFNMHLNTKDIDKLFVVRKPTEDGIVTSFELFNKEGELVVYFFGARKPGKPELEAWRSVVNTAVSSCVGNAA